MKDHELRAVVLQKYYDLRHRGRFQWCELDEKELSDDFPFEKFEELGRICGQLAEHGLIEWDPVLGARGEPVGGIGGISAFGVDVIEGTAKAPIAISFHQKTITVSGSHGFRIGDGDGDVFSAATNIQMIQESIDKSESSATEKAEAKSLLEKVCDNKLLNTIIGSAVGELTKAALPK